MCTSNYKSADSLMGYAKSPDGAAELSVMSGGIGSAFTGYASTIANNATLKAQQAAFLMNASDLEYKARDTTEQGRDATAWLGVRGRMEVGAARNEMSARGVDINYGSAKSYQTSLKQANLMDRYNTRYNAMQAAFGFENQALNARQQAEAAKLKRGNPFMTALLAGGKALYSGYSALKGG